MIDSYESACMLFQLLPSLTLLCTLPNRTHETSIIRASDQVVGKCTYAKVRSQQPHFAQHSPVSGSSPPRRTRKPSHYLPLHAHSKSPLFPSLLKHLSQLSPLKSLGHFHLLPHFRHITLKHFIVASQSSQLLHHHFITHITG